MPRTPTGRRSRSFILRPTTFSPFARSLARATSSHVIKRHPIDANPHERIGSTSGKRITKRDKLVKSELIESSDEEMPADKSSNEEVSEGEVQVDFAFFDPKPDDFHGVKILLQTYLDDNVWDLSGFVDLILEQTTVGTVVKLEDDEDNNIFSVVTALNLGRYKGHKCINEIKEFLYKIGQAENIKERLRVLLEHKSHNVGLLVSQRVANFPYQLLPPLYDGLFDEVSWATQDEPTEELRKSFRYKTYLIVTKIYELKNVNRQSSESDEAVIYAKPEDELFLELSSWSFRFPLHVAPVSTQELRDYRLMGLVMAVDAEKVPIFRKKVHALVA